MRQKKPLDKQFNSWEELIIALRCDYTTSFCEVCNILQASRSWVNRYVRPNVSAVYISNNKYKRKDGSHGQNWVQLASIELKKPMTESIWFHTEDFFQFLNACTYSVTKQTKSVPVGLFMTAENYKSYLQKLEKLNEQIVQETSLFGKNVLLKEKEECHLEYLPNDKQIQELIKKGLSVTNRTQAKPTSVNLKYTDIPCENWKAPHDLKGYGDADELIYRMFFREGYIKIDLQLHDVNGEMGRKVFYAPDPNYLQGEGKRIILAEDIWQKYLGYIN